MSKAEDRYLDLFQDGILRNCSSREAFLYGYRQAERDLELSWEDISLLRSILFDVEHEGFTKFPYEEFCKEVLKRFKEQRNDRH